MQSKRCPLLLVLSLLLLVACDRKHESLPVASDGEERMLCPNLAVADSLMEISPDSALVLLRKDSSAVLRAGQQERMYYTLLRTQAEDKLFVPHRSDSAIREVAVYYKEHGDAHRQIQAFYLLGRVSSDLHRISSAISAFRQALEVEGEDSVIYRHKTKTASWLSSIYEDNDMYQEMLDACLLTYRYAQKSDCSEGQQVYALRDIGRSYRRLKNYPEAIKYYKHAISLASKIKNEKDRCMVESGLAALYLDAGMLREAESVLRNLSVSDIYEVDLPLYYSTVARYYEKIGNLDSAACYYKKNIEISSFSSKVTALERLVDIYTKLGQLAEVQGCNELLAAYKDSVHVQIQAEARDNIQNIEAKAGALKQTEKLSKSNFALMLFLLAAVVAGLAGFFYVKRSYLRKVRQMRLQVDENSANMLIPSLLDSLISSEIYRRFHQDGFLPSNDDFKALKDTLDKECGSFIVNLEKLSGTLRREEKYVCYMIKIGLPAKKIWRFISYKNANSLTMMESRLYKKLTGKEGKAKDLVSLICKL